MKLIEILGFVASAFEMCQLYFLGKRKKIGFVCGALGGICWITFSIIAKSAFGLIAVCSLGLILNTKGFIHWRNHERNM